MAMRDAAADPRSARRRRAAPGGPLRDDPRRRAGEGLPAPRSGWSSSASRSSASCSTTRPAGRPGRSSGSRRPRGRRRGGGRSTLADANAGPGHRRLGQAKAERLQAAAADSIAVPELDAEVAFEVGLLLDQYDLLERQIEAADRRVAALLDGETARRLQTIPGVGPSIAATLLAEIGDIARFTDFDQLLAYRRRPPRRAQLGPQGRRTPRPPGTCRKAGNSHLRAAAYRMAVVGRPAQPGHRRPLRPQARRRQVQDERPRPLHAQGAQPRLGRLAQRSRLRPRLGARGLTRPYGI